jgi:hypothetical protein
VSFPGLCALRPPRNVDEAGKALRGGGESADEVLAAALDDMDRDGRVATELMDDQLDSGETLHWQLVGRPSKLERIL